MVDSVRRYGISAARRPVAGFETNKNWTWELWLPQGNESAIPKVRSSGVHSAQNWADSHLPSLPLTHPWKWTAKDIQNKEHKTDLKWSFNQL